MDSVKTFYNNYRDIITKLLTIIIFFTFIYIFVEYLFTLLSPFIIGYIISMILRPFIRFFNGKCKIPRSPSVILSIILIIGLIGLIGTTIFILLKSQVTDLYANRAEFFDSISFVLDKFLALVDKIFFLVPDVLKETTETFISDIVPELLATLGRWLQSISISIVTSIPSIFVHLLFGLISSFFFARDRELINRVLTEKTPEVVLSNLRLFKKTLNDALGGYIRAQLILMCLTGVLAIAFLTIFRFPYGLLIGLLIAIVDALPFFGSGFFLWPWAAYYFFSGDVLRGGLLLGLYILIQLNRQIWEPRVLGKQIGLHPLVTLMSVFIGGSILGIFGVILGPITVVIVKAILETEVDYEKNKKTIANGD